MEQRNMTPDELRTFEEEQIHDSTDTPPVDRPASEAIINPESNPPPVVIPPNPD
jgi:hypothetical protein